MSTSLPDLSWMVGKRFAGVRLDKADWTFELEGGGTVKASASLWRIVSEGRVSASSRDHGQSFGKTGPVDAIAEARKWLAGSPVARAGVREDTGDLVIELGSGPRLEVLTTSIGREAWQAAGPAKGKVTPAAGTATGLEVDLEKIVDALEKTDDRTRFWLNRRTGQLVTWKDSDPVDSGDAAGEAPAAEGAPALVELPDRHELDEFGIMEAFCKSVADPELRAELLAAIKGPGPFSRFKALARAKEFIDPWYDHRREAFRAIASRWCRGHGFSAAPGRAKPPRNRDHEESAGDAE